MIREAHRLPLLPALLPILLGVSLLTAVLSTQAPATAGTTLLPAAAVPSHGMAF